MWTRACVLAAIIVSAMLCGCLPKRINWSHDGKKAAVIGEKGLYLCDAEGQISDLLLPNVWAAEWLPDDQRLVLVMELKLDSWKAIEQYLWVNYQIAEFNFFGQCPEIIAVANFLGFGCYPKLAFI